MLVISSCVNEAPCEPAPSTERGPIRTLKTEAETDISFLGAQLRDEGCDIMHGVNLRTNVVGEYWRLLSVPWVKGRERGWRVNAVKGVYI